MADPNLGQTVASAWEAIVKPDPTDNIFEDYWLLNKLQAGSGIKTVDGGRLIEAPIEYATNTTVGFMGEMDQLSTTRVDITDVTQYSWKILGGTVVQSEYEDAINQGSGGKFPLLAAKLSNLKKSNEAIINASLFSDGTGTSSKEFGGLQLLVANVPTTGTVGGINRANSAFWRNITVTGTMSSAAFDNLRASMRSGYNQASNGVKGEHPTFGVTTRTVFEGYEGLLLANERFTDKSSGEGAFKNEVLKFKGMELAYDNDCLAAALYMLNPKYIKLAVQKGRWMKMMDEVEPANQLTRIFRIATIGNMYTTNPRMLAVVHTIT